jgi:hypothetical protein
MLPQIPVAQEPAQFPPGAGAVAMRPRYRWTGVWF